MAVVVGGEDESRRLLLAPQVVETIQAPTTWGGECGHRRPHDRLDQRQAHEASGHRAGPVGLVLGSGAGRLALGLDADRHGGGAVREGQAPDQRAG
jgi:hypothetical protein